MRIIMMIIVIICTPFVRDLMRTLEDTLRHTCRFIVICAHVHTAVYASTRNGG